MLSPSRHHGRNQLRGACCSFWVSVVVESVVRKVSAFRIKASRCNAGRSCPPGLASRVVGVVVGKDVRRAMVASARSRSDLCVGNTMRCSSLVSAENDSMTPRQIGHVGRSSALACCTAAPPTKSPAQSPQKKACRHGKSRCVMSFTQHTQHRSAASSALVVSRSCGTDVVVMLVGAVPAS